MPTLNFTTERDRLAAAFVVRAGRTPGAPTPRR
jgi:hypothetical protein